MRKRTMNLTRSQRQDLIKSAVIGMSIVFLALASDESRSATATANVTATIAQNITVGTVNDMSFGELSASSIAGTVVISTGGSRSTTGGVSVNSTVPGSAAEFDIQGETNASFAITLPTTMTLSDGVNSMTINNFLSTPSVSGVLNTSGQQSLFVGATLNVGSNQAFGAYTGIMSIAIEYN